MTITIQNGLPPPSSMRPRKTGRPKTFPFGSLQVGQSFTVTEASVPAARTSLCRYRKADPFVGIKSFPLKDGRVAFVRIA